MNNAKYNLSILILMLIEMIAAVVVKDSMIKYDIVVYGLSITAVLALIGVIYGKKTFND